MFLHLGNDVSVRMSEILSIHDSAVFLSGENQAYLESMGKKHAIEDSNCLLKNAKSLVITEKKIYFSPISSMTLKRRATNGYKEE